jgi:hypothetical protein
LTRACVRRTTIFRSQILISTRQRAVRGRLPPRHVAG